MRFLRGLVFHVGRVVAGLFAVMALAVALVVGGWMYATRQAETEERATAILSQEETKPVAPAAEVAELPAVRVVAPPAPKVEEPRVAPPPPPRIDAIGKIDQATRDYFDTVIYLVETGTRRNPKSCDGVVDWVLWVSLYQTWRSEITRDEFSGSEALSFFLTMGASELVRPGNERWTIFTAETEGRYIAFTLGESRRDKSSDKVGAQTRMTFYRMDDKRLGLVEQVPLTTPPAARPARKVPVIERVYLVCRRV
ncbi:MAG: hypothetical protein ABI399_12745 [Bauldia sp.]